MSPLQDITLGRYLPRNSPIHRLDPRAKLGLCALLTAAAFFPGSRFAVLCVVPALVLGVGLSQLPAGLLLRGLRPFLWLFGFTVFLQAVSTPGKPMVTVPGFGVPITWQGLARGLEVAAQLAAAVTFSSLLTLTTSPTDLLWGMERLGAPLARLGLPVGEFCMSLLIAIRFFPLVQGETERLRLAFAARAAPGAKAGLRRRVRILSCLLSSLCRRVLVRAEQMALAMELRGFVPGTAWNIRRAYGFRRPEWGALVLGGLTLVAASLLRGWGGA